MSDFDELAAATRATVAGRISVAMTRQRMSERTLAAKSGLTGVTIAHVLEGRSVRLDTILVVAFALNLQLSELFAPARHANQN